MSAVEIRLMDVVLFVKQSDQMGLGKLLLSNTSHCISVRVSEPEALINIFIY